MKDTKYIDGMFLFYAVMTAFCSIITLHAFLDHNEIIMQAFLAMGFSSAIPMIIIFDVIKDYRKKKGE